MTCRYLIIKSKWQILKKNYEIRFFQKQFFFAVALVTTTTTFTSTQDKTDLSKTIRDNDVSDHAGQHIFVPC